MARKIKSNAAQVAVYFFYLFPLFFIFENTVPVSTGWMQLRNKVKAKTTARLETASATSGLLVKGTPYTFLRAKISTKKKMPIITDDMSTTQIENLAALGLPAPSSFDILTLKKKLYSNDDL